MRALFVASILSLSAVAAADPPDHAAEVAAQLHADLKAGDAGALAADLSTPLAFMPDASLLSPDCKKQFGDAHEVKDPGELKAVATCVLGIEGIADYDVVPHAAPLATPNQEHAIHIFVPRGARTASILMITPRRDPNAPPSVAPNVLNAYRISGETQIIPDAKTQKAMQKAKKRKLVAAVKLCIKTSGDLASVDLLKSSGFPDYDKLIVSTVAMWKYKPYMVNGVATAACTAVMFIYTQAN